MLHCEDLPGSAVDSVQYLEDGVLIVENGRILALVPADQAFAQGVQPEQCRELGRKLVVPGFIDTHVHAYQFDVIGSYGEQLLEWLERYTFPSEMRMADPALAAEAANFFIEQLLANGTTSALVFSTVHQQATEALFQRAAELDLCMITGKTLMDRNAPEALLDDPDRAWRESLQLIERWHNEGRLRYAVTPRFAITSTPAQLAVAGLLVQRFPDLYVQTHLSENRAEIAFVKELFPDCRDYLDVYDSYGLCTERAVFAHCVHLEEREMERLREAGAVISSCPSSNMFLGSGLFEWQRMQKAGLKLSLGTDVGAGTSASMLATLGDLYKVAQLRAQVFKPLEAFHAITLGNARALQLQDRIGNLAPGTDADFVILDPDADPLIARRVAASQNISDEWFVYMTLGGSNVVSETWVAGQQRYCAARPQ